MFHSTVTNSVTSIKSETQDDPIFNAFMSDDPMWNAPQADDYVK